MTLGAFGVIIALSTPERPVETVDDLAGLGQTHPADGPGDGALPVQPGGHPAAGGLLRQVRDLRLGLRAPARTTTPGLFRWLAVIGVLNAAIGAYYYLRIVVVMFFRPPADRSSGHARAAWPTTVAVATCARLSLLVGLYPTPIARASRQAAVASISHDSLVDETSAPKTAAATSPGR